MPYSGRKWCPTIVLKIDWESSGRLIGIAFGKMDPNSN